MLVVRKSVADYVQRRWGTPALKKSESRREAFLREGDPAFEWYKKRIMSLIKERINAADEGRLEKAGYAIGTPRVWKDGHTYVKVAPNKWRRKYDASNEGGYHHKATLTRFYKRIAGCTDEKEIQATIRSFVLQFRDASGYPMKWVPDFLGDARKALADAKRMSNPAAADEIEQGHREFAKKRGYSGARNFNYEDAKSAGDGGEPPSGEGNGGEPPDKKSPEIEKDLEGRTKTLKERAAVFFKKPTPHDLKKLYLQARILYDDIQKANILRGSKKTEGLLWELNNQVTHVKDNLYNKGKYNYIDELCKAELEDPRVREDKKVVLREYLAQKDLVRDLNKKCNSIMTKIESFVKEPHSLSEINEFEKELKPAIQNYYQDYSLFSEKENLRKQKLKEFNKKMHKEWIKVANLVDRWTIRSLGNMSEDEYVTYNQLIANRIKIEDEGNLKDFVNVDIYLQTPYLGEIKKAKEDCLKKEQDKKIEQQAEEVVKKTNSFKKFKLSNFANGEKNWVLGGIWHSNGFKMATDGRILIAEKSSYEPEKEGKAFDEEGSDIHAPYMPSWQRVIPRNSVLTAFAIDFNELNKKAQIALQKQKMKKDDSKTISYVQINRPDGQIMYLSAKYVRDLCSAAKQYGIKTFAMQKDITKAAVVSNNNASVVVMPMQDSVKNDGVGTTFDMKGAKEVPVETPFDDDTQKSLLRSLRVIRKSMARARRIAQRG